MERTFGLVVIISVITVDFSGFVLGLSVDNQLANARNGKVFWSYFGTADATRRQLHVTVLRVMELMLVSKDKKFVPG